MPLPDIVYLGQLVDFNSPDKRDIESLFRVMEGAIIDGSVALKEYWANQQLFQDRKISDMAYWSKVMFLHAHSFLYSVDLFIKGLNALAEYPDLPEGVNLAKQILEQQLPYAVKIRNSAHHIEDRARGFLTVGQAKKKQKAEVEILAQKILFNHSIGYTVDDGSLQYLPIDPNLLAFLINIMNQVLASFTWEGGQRTASPYSL